MGISIVDVAVAGLAFVLLALFFLLLRHTARSRRPASTPSTVVSAAMQSPIRARLDAAVRANHGDGPVVVSGGSFLTEGRFRNTTAARVGREGEDRVLAEVERALDSRWYVFRNMILPGSNGDLDLVLVGPGGTLVLEVKAYSGDWRVEKGRWYKRTSNGYWAHQPFGPGAQAIENAKRLCLYLKAGGMTAGVGVNPVVVLAGDAHIDFESAGTKIWRQQDLPDRLAKLSRRTDHASAQVQQIATLLMAGTLAAQPLAS